MSPLGIVTCGHELASSLGAPRRALTAALNARIDLARIELVRAEKLLASQATSQREYDEKAAMVKDYEASEKGTLYDFLQTRFCRVSSATASKFCAAVIPEPQ